MQHDISLRAITSRLNATPVEDLPRIAGYLATQLANCPLELDFSDTKGKSSSVTAHRLKTRISSLLQDRTAAGRFTAVILVKAVVDHGGQNALGASESWARGLLSCLRKQDPFEVKKLYLITITRIFLLTENNPSLTREITTPLLPTFIKTCLELIKPNTVQIGPSIKQVSSPLLDSVLACWIQLVPRHATVFRPFLSHVKPICLSLLGNTESSALTRDSATRLLCLLLSSSPKNTMSQEWSQMAGGILDVAAETASTLFRAIIEEHESNSSNRQAMGRKHNFSKEPQRVENDQLGLGPWLGIYEGSNRLAILLSWLEKLISTATSLSVSIPVGAISDLTSRIMSVVVPDNKTSAADGLRYHTEASREEKEELWVNLPRIHISCLRLLHRMCVSFGQALFPLHGSVITQMLDFVEKMSWHEGVRCAVYDIFQHLLRETNISDLELRRAAFSNLTERCCDDLRSIIAVHDVGKPSSTVKDASRNNGVALLTGSISQPQGASQPVFSLQSDVHQAAWRLLPEILPITSTNLIPRQVRIEMDRLAVLLDHQDALLASVMHPVLSKAGKATTASLLPFLVKSAPENMAVETLLRPRMYAAQIDGPAPSTLNNATISVDDRNGDTDDHQEGDLLSQLENSINELEDNNLAVNDARETLAPRKRTFDDVSDNAPEEAAPVPEQIHLREWKRIRPEEATTPLDIVREGGGNEDARVDDAIVEEVAEKTTFVQRPAKTEDPVSGSTSRSLVGNLSETREQESDSSDSEIPMIDTGMDTEDDEEESE